MAIRSSVATLRFAVASRKTNVVARLILGVTVLLVLLVGVSLASLTMGPVNIPLTHVASVLFDNLGLDFASHTTTERLVIEQLRFPRILVGALVGMALGVSGATMQGLFRNPMADPAIRRTAPWKKSFRS